MKNNKLSWGSIGLLSYIKSLPKDKLVIKSTLLDKATDGKYSFEKYYKELIDNDYIRSTELRDERGRFKGYSVTLKD